MPSQIEPCFVDGPRGELLDLLTELPATAGKLGDRLHPRTAASLASLVRVMNCYYSNLIEGHNTRPRDIERALRAKGVSRSYARTLTAAVKGLNLIAITGGEL